MTSDQVKSIALAHLTNQQMDGYVVCAARKFVRNEGPTDASAEWSVQFRGVDEDGFPNYIIVVVDDETGRTSLFESL